MGVGLLIQKVTQWDGTPDLLQPIEALMRGLILEISCEEDVIEGADTMGWRSWLRR